MELHNKLIDYSKKHLYSLHMPGHKNRLGFSKIDYTEVPGLDDLHSPKDIILDLMEECSKLYGSKKTFLSTNGSTAGILAAIGAVATFTDKILVGRQVHKSVHNGIFLHKMIPHFVYPKINEFGICIGYDYCEIENIIIKNKIKAMIFTTPTYEGVDLDTSKLNDIALRNDCFLILDEAHGAHFLDGTRADISVQSLHKMLPALTSTAIIHCNNEKLSNLLNKYLSIYITSSPSYILLSSISECVSIIKNKKQLFEIAENRLNKIRNKLLKLEKLNYLLSDDIYKIVIGVSNVNISGKELYDKVYSTGYVLEMCTDLYIVALTSIYDDWDKVDEFVEILLDIDKNLHIVDDKEVINFRKLNYVGIDSLYSYSINVRYAIGKICAEPIFLYPPGIALISYGEIFDDEVIKDIIYYYENGYLDTDEVKVSKVD